MECRRRWQIPKQFAPFATAQGYFHRFCRDGTLDRLNHVLVIQARELARREASPTAGVIDSQSVKATEAGGPREFDAGEKITGASATSSRIQSATPSAPWFIMPVFRTVTG
ncbi:hypothetical protein ACMV_24650 [Acidiphilium multivorum AIU301]|uniref:Transposase n=1 Tax=Acidiphilium multivorum (strain DSM 11245 / JCM 8867 / NBRC 100883 / AIU 301) TaxID=926570 RepID=F0J1R9_ACIMA|nr:hypothetical protein ACMV_24650 [Acidiphilium multivorum AIU301]